jgi:hypothetical protein
MLLAALQLVIVGLSPGANPTTLIYNASVVNFHNATSSQASFEHIFFLFWKTV